MIGPDDKRPCGDVLYEYQALVSAKHGALVKTWPLLNGWNLVQAAFGDWMVVYLKDDPFSALSRATGFGELDEATVGARQIDALNKDVVRGRLERHFAAGPRDAVLLYPPDNVVADQLVSLLQRHETAQGLTPMKIFLSHKGADKPKVRDFKSTLQMLGFSPWLDEDSMRAGAELERAILKGFQDSCAAVFFITANFKDESFLSTEVDYAIQEKRRKGDAFAIITIVFDSSVARSNVPELLRRYVWKEPASDLDALREIVGALPIQVGDVRWK